MFVSTRTAISATKNNMDLSGKSSSSVRFSKKYDLNSNNFSYKNKSLKYELNKKDDFKNILDLKADSKIEDIKKPDEYDKADELDKDDDEKDKEKRDYSKDDISEILSSILGLLNKLDKSENTLGSKENVNDNILKFITEGTNNKSSNNDLSDVMKQLLEALQKDSTKDQLNSNSLDSIQKLLSQLNEKLGGDNTEFGDKVKSGIKDLMSEISKTMENKQAQGDKILSLEDILKKDLSKQNSESSLKDESSNEGSKNNSKTLKEDKFLKGLINDDKDNSLNRMNLFAPKIQTTQQGQIVNSTQPVDINKANFTNDLIKDVKYMATNSLKELIVKVNPGNLGEITIKLIQEDGITKANLKANSKETTALLTQNLVDIKKQLAEQNIKIEHVNIELYQDDTTFFRQEEFNKQFQQEQGRNNNLRDGNVRSNNLDDDSEESLIESIDTITNNNVDYLA